MLSQMHTSLSRHELAGILMQKLEKSNVLKEDLAHYYRQEPGHPDHSYEYLINSMTKYLTRKRYDVNRVGGIQSILENMGRGAAPAVDDDIMSKRAKAKKRPRMPPNWQLNWLLRPQARARVAERETAISWASVIFTIQRPGALKLPKSVSLNIKS